MKLTVKASIAVIVFFAGTLLGLSACQTTPATPAPAPKAAPAAAPEPAKPVEAPKPITPEGARNLAIHCFTCHGPGGLSPGSIPSLSKLSADELAVKLNNFRNGTASSTVMGRHAKGYTEAEIDAMANYIAGLKK